MDTTHKPRPAVASLLFALAGLAFLVSALLMHSASRVIVGTQAVGVLAFFALSYVWYRRARREGA